MFYIRIQFSPSIPTKPCEEQPPGFNCRMGILESLADEFPYCRSGWIPLTLELDVSMDRMESCGNHTKFVDNHDSSLEMGSSNWECSFWTLMAAFSTF